MSCKVEDYIHVALFFVSPGLGADDRVDELVKEICGDADVFVYVCNGTSTLEATVNMSFLSTNLYSSVTCIVKCTC